MPICNWKELHNSKFEGKKCLITGGAGFIGSHLVDALVELNADITILDDLSGGTIDNVFHQKNKIKFIQGSILDHSLLLHAINGCQFVFHLAALGSVPRSIETPEVYQEVNVMGTFEVLEAARKANVEKFIFSSSSSVYGDSSTLPKIETMPVLPKSPYAASKVAGEAMVRSYAECYALDTISLRYFNIFGPRQNFNSAYAAVIAAFCKSLLDGAPLQIYGNGEQSRDFTFVENAVYANLLAAQSSNKLDGKVVNVACGIQTTINTLAKILSEFTSNKNSLICHNPKRSGDVLHSFADLSISKNQLTFDPLVDLKTGLQTTFSWYEKKITNCQLS